MKPVSILVAFLLFSPVPSGYAQPATPQSTCAEWQACRDLAEQARAAGDYETFHDLAWRAVQKRGRRDPELFFLLARAQSLSARPHDAMVTLQRLAQEMHAPKDVSQDEDFRRVRALPGWPELQALIAAAASNPEANTEANTEGTARGKRLGESPGGAPPEREGRAGGAPPEREARAGGAPTERSPRTGGAGATSEEVARFAAGSFEAGGLAYDAVSRRFVIGNLPARKLTIVEEGTNRAATLSGDAAQLLNVRALEIDRAQGDLWVVSEGSRDASDDPTSELHKLQLVSGRVLAIYTAEPSTTPNRFVDVAVGPSMGVLVLDAAGPRLFRPARNRRALVEAMVLPPGEVTSLAPADDGRTVYVAYADHIARIDIRTQRIQRVAGKGLDAAGFTRVRWHKGSLVGAQVRDGGQRIVQLRLAVNGRRVISARTLDASEAPATTLAALDVLDDDFFYLVAGAPQASIRRIRLK